MVLDSIAKKNFVVVGRVGMDLTPEPANTRTQDASSMMVAMGGSSANIAAGLAKLGCRSALITTVSDDSVGWYCLNQLDHYGVDRTHVKKITGECRTSLAVYETRIEEHQSVIYRNDAADFQMNIEDVEAVDYSQYGALITAGNVFAALSRKP
jgi:5-dehydro-2-deoxygluconokinase